jgi:T5SS/PEP-CTERM-associated repeat protein
LAVSVFAVPVRAASIQWNGGFSQFWHQEFNWDPFGSPFSIRRIPTDIDTATLLTPAGDDVYLGGNTEPINGLTVGNGIDFYTNGFLLQVDNAGAATTSIAGGAELHVDPRVGGAGFETDNLFLTGGGILNLDGGDAVVQGNTTIFGNSSVIGSLFSESIYFGGNVSVIDSSVLRMLNGADTVFTAGTTVSAETSSIIDLSETTNIINGVTFEFTTSARMEADNLNIGNNGAGVGSTGTLTLDKAGGAGLLPRLDVSQNLSVGDDTTGTALLQAINSQISVVGTTTVYATGTVELDGTQLGAHDVMIDGGTITAVNQNNPIFLFEDATLTATNGALVDIDGDQEIWANGLFEFLSGSDLIVSGDLTVGTDPVGQGILSVDGAGSTLDVGGKTVLGENMHPGIMFLKNGAEATVADMDIAVTAGGTLFIESGATLSGNFARLALNSGVGGSAVVDGPGSAWTLASFLGVGSSGLGSVNIINGGSVSCATAYLGSDGAAKGTVTVSGAGSAWDVTGFISLGAGQLGDLGGTGIVNLNGGTIDAGIGIRIYSNGDFNFNSGTLTTPAIELHGGSFDWHNGTLHVASFTGNLINQGGTLSPGNSAGSTAITGNYAHQAGATLDIEIGGSAPILDYDQVSVSGIVTLGGELRLSLIDGFVPTAGDTFVVLDALGGISGLFSNVINGTRLDTADGNGSFLVHYGPGSLFDPDSVILSGYMTTLIGDLNADGFVGIADLNIVLGNWNQAVPPGDPLADPSGDDFVGIADLNLVLGNWNAGTPPGLGANIPEPAGAALVLTGLGSLLGRNSRRVCSL